jgi:[acyl-carrier-protein] S-malonyltransferase
VRWALVFSGQGMQHDGMLPWLPRNEMLLAVEHQLAPNWRERLADAAWAGNNAHAQFLLTGTALAAWAELAPLLPPPAIVAGYSVGELAAFSAAGVYDSGTALVLAAQRAACMDLAAAEVPTGLMAASGGAPGAIDALCRRFGLEIAIRNGADSVVLGGLRSALQAAEAAAPEQGLHCTPLNVALASHTHWLQPAAEGFARHLASHLLAAPRRVLLSNARGRIRTADQAREALSAQIACTVRWDECMEALAAQQVRAVLEIGPGQALARLWQQAHAEIPARSADEFRTAVAVAAWLHKAME